MRRYFASFVIALAAIVAAAPGETGISAPGGDGMYTDVKIEGNVVTIIVPLAVVYALSESAGPPDAAGVAIVEEGFAAAAAFWNAGFARLSACYEVRVQVDVAFTTEEGSGAPELDRFHLVHPYHQWRSGEFPDGRGLPTVVYPGIAAGSLPGDADTTHPFDNFSVGYLPGWLFEDPWALAHELGHFFGLGDDYGEDGINPGREGTLMGGTEGADYIDQAILDDVTKLIDEAGYDLPGCITGRFSYDLEQHFETEFQKTDTEYRLVVTFNLKPKGDGTLEGEGRADFYNNTHHLTKSDLPERRCESFIGPIEDGWTVKLSGRFNGEVLSFEVEPTSKTITFNATGSCGTDSFPHEVAHFPGWAGITFTDGIYTFEQVTPGGPSDTGSTLVELTLKKDPPD